MSTIIIRWFDSAASIMLAAYILPGISLSGGLYIALIVAVLLGIVNTLVRPVLFVLTLPINILTLGLFTFVLNGLFFLWIASFVKGFDVSGLFAAILGAILVSLFSAFGNRYIVSSGDRDGREKS